MRHGVQANPDSSASGLGLIIAAAAALIWANSPAAPLYQGMLHWRSPIGTALPPLQFLVNDGLMAVFFLLVGLEIRREMTIGHLASLRAAAAPGIAALGGMILPACIYLALNGGNPATRHGWATPIATDIAFSLAVLRLFAPRDASPLRAFLGAVAIIDDLAAIIVIALFYTRAFQPGALQAAGMAWIALGLLRRLGIASIWPYLLLGVVIWVFLERAGVQPTLAGVVLALTVPAAGARDLERRLEPWVGYAVLPVFGLFNAGIDLRSLHGAALFTTAPLGVFLGLALGKPAGVMGATLLGRRLHIVALPPAMGLRDLGGAALLCGIGFTMSLFIGNLAFRASAAQDSIKVAILCASLVSALGGVGFLRIRK
jgi:NhaA family Na+:H+ antiporter